MTQPLESLTGAAYLPLHDENEEHPDLLVGDEVEYDLTESDDE